MPYPYEESFETTGEQWREDGDDLKKMFPKLFTKYNTPDIGETRNLNNENQIWDSV